VVPNRCSADVLGGEVPTMTVALVAAVLAAALCWFTLKGPRDGTR
jgi:hypothetical protein